MPSDKLIAKKQDGIGRMILNNPERHNAISLEMWEAALEAMAGFSADPAVRVMVLTGAGSKAFASGADISKFRDERQEAEALAHYQKTTAKAYAALQAMAIPTIATVRGYCIGGGTAVAVCCDIRICNEGARFGVPAAKLGLGYGLERSTPLIDLVGPAFARRCSSPAASSAPRKPWAGPGQPRRCGRSARACGAGAGADDCRQRAAHRALLQTRGRRGAQGRRIARRGSHRTCRGGLLREQ